MALPPIPSNVLPYIQQAATGTGLPESVVAAQNYTESGYGSNEGPSSAGAEGPWQFLPSTFQGVMGTLTGITSWATSTQAYIKYMNSLLKQENGNVRDALAAYNAGPLNKAAGYGYADQILAEAGQSSTLKTTTAASTTTSAAGGIGGLLSIPSEITGFFSDADSFVTKIMWLVNPANWLRVGSFAIAIVLLLGAIIIFTKADTKINAPMPIPVPV